MLFYIMSFSNYVMHETSTLNTLVKTQKHGWDKILSKTFAFKNAYGNKMLQESYETEIE